MRYHLRRGPINVDVIDRHHRAVMHAELTDRHNTLPDIWCLFWFRALQEPLF